MSDMIDIRVPLEELATAAELLDDAEAVSDPDGDNPEAAAVWLAAGVMADMLGLRFADGEWQALPPFDGRLSE